MQHIYPSQWGSNAAPDRSNIKSPRSLCVYYYLSDNGADSQIVSLTSRPEFGNRQQQSISNESVNANRRAHKSLDVIHKAHMKKPKVRVLAECKLGFIMCFYNSHRAYSAFMETLFILLVNETALCGFSYLWFCLPQSHRVANLTTLETGTMGVQE